MRRWMGVGLALVLVLGVAGCGWGKRIRDLEVWADSMAVNRRNPTTPDTPDDPAYSLRQSRAICKLLERVEAIDSIPPAERDDWLKALCGIPPTDPVYPPGFPPET